MHSKIFLQGYEIRKKNRLDYVIKKKDLTIKELRIRRKLKNNLRVRGKR